MQLKKATKTSYLGNSKIKKAGVPLSYTQEQIEEWTKCSLDPVYFIKNYAKIINIDKGLIPLELYDFQEDMVNLFHKNRFAIVRCSRQIGKSTTVSMYVLWCIIFQPYQSVLILAHNGGQAKRNLAAIKLAYENLPHWIQQGVVEWNKGSIELENGSKVTSCATGSSAARGGSHNIVILDEYAFVRDSIADEFFKSTFPTISSGQTSKLFIISTPNGMNDFYNKWVLAENKVSEFVPFTAYWWQVPWKDEEWKRKEIANLGSEQAFEQEHGVEFHGASDTLIPSSVLSQKFVVKEPVLVKSGNLKIYEAPKKENKYFITVDVSKGVDLDYSTITVFDITQLPYKQVAVFRDNKTHPMLLPTMIYSIAKEYNECYVLVENNEVGSQVVSILYSDLEYENILWCKKVKNRTTICYGGSKAELGIRTTKSVKLIGCTTLRALFDSNKLVLHDKDTFKELTNFVKKGGSFAAKEGNTDDLVMNLVHFSWCTQQNVFKEIAENDSRRAIEQDLDPEIVPFGFVSRGNDDNKASASDLSNLLNFFRK